jgi:hypothetical protein
LLRDVALKVLENGIEMLQICQPFDMWDRQAEMPKQIPRRVSREDGNRLAGNQEQLSWTEELTNLRGKGLCGLRLRSDNPNMLRMFPWLKNESLATFYNHPLDDFVIAL